MRLFIVLGVLAVFALPTTGIAQPANDECAGAIDVGFTGAGTVTGWDNTTATTSADPVNDAVCAGTAIGTCESDIWYSWTPAQDGIVQMSTCDLTTVDTDILVYSGACGALTEVSCNGDGPCTNFTSLTPFFLVTAGTTYTIRLGGWNSGTGVGTGTITISVGGGGPATEDCTNGTDDDGDGVLDVNDAFPLDATESLDTDADGIGNNADTDDDGDGFDDPVDNCPRTVNPLQMDGDTDMVGDLCDNCPTESNTDQEEISEKNIQSREQECYKKCSARIRI